jgi:predicted nucleotidyltransferase
MRTVREIEARLASCLGGLDGVEVAALFGSAAPGRRRPESDLDVYVRLVPSARWDLGRRLDVAAELSRLSGREVDLVVEGETTSVILRRGGAARGRLLFEARPGAWTDTRARARVAYADIEPYLRRIGAAIRAHARRHG